MLVRTIPQALRRAEERITGRKSKTEEFPQPRLTPFYIVFGVYQYLLKYKRG